MSNDVSPLATWAPGATIPVATALSALIPGMFQISGSLPIANLVCTVLDPVTLQFGWGSANASHVVARFVVRPVRPDTITL
jgi:hypothetical protein